METVDQKYTFLVVEDALSYRLIIQEIILNYLPNSEILSAYNVLDALQIFQGTKSIDLIIADLDIPKSRDKPTLTPRQGFTFMKEVRSVNKNIPIIVYTAFSDQDSIEKIKEVDAHYVKKYSWVNEPLELMAKIAALLQIKLS